MSKIVDIAEDLKVIPAALPEIEFAEDIDRSPDDTPPELVEGILHQGCKMILGGNSKTNKTWCLLNLALSVSTGQPFWGRRCFKAPVLFINFELPPWAIKKRLQALRSARPECQVSEKMLAIWNLRGRGCDFALLRPKLEEHLVRHNFALIIIDPVYKLLGNRDENSNGEVADLMNEMEALAQTTGAAIVLAHHFAKGDSAAKSAVDRMSGAGAWARDPDSLLTLTQHEEDNCYTVSSILRNLAQLPEFVLRWEYPLMRVASDLNPEALRRPQTKNKVCTDKEFLDAVFTNGSANFTRIVDAAKLEFGMSRRTTARYLERGQNAGTIVMSAGLYWPKSDNN